MDADDQAQRDAEHKAAALHHLGWETGAGATIWARAISDSLALHESARDRYAAKTADRETWHRLHSSALMVVIAIDQVLAFERRVRSLTGDADLARARERFNARCRDAEDLRDLIVHLDEYAIGEGQRQRGKRMPPLDATYQATFLYWGESGGTNVNLGDRTVDLRTAANAAITLSVAVEKVRAKYLKRAEKKANEALLRRHGRAP